MAAKISLTLMSSPSCSLSWKSQSLLSPNYKPLVQNTHQISLKKSHKNFGVILCATRNHGNNNKSGTVSTGGRNSSVQEQKWVHEGVVTESLPNGMFQVQLDNEDSILGYISGKIRRSFIRILPGDRVRIEVSRYDSSRGRITYRLRNKDGQ